MMTPKAGNAKQTCVNLLPPGRHDLKRENSMSFATFLNRGAKLLSAGFLLAFAAPLAAHSLVHWSRGGPESWNTADWSSTGTLPAAQAHKPAMVRIFAARTGRWKGNFAVHSWIVLKTEGGEYRRFDKVGWGSPIRLNNYPPDGLWYSNRPFEVFAADGEKAARLIPRIEAAIRAYPFSRRGDYTIWPGPNSNTFVACVMSEVPEIAVPMSPLAIGKDFPCNGSWFGRTASHTGFRASLGGFAGITLAWIEGFEINIFGAIAGIDIRRPALKLPGFGRIGMPVT